MARRKGSSKRGKGSPLVTGGRHHTIYDRFEHVFDRLKKKMTVRKAAAIANAMYHKGYKSHKGMKKAMKRHSAKRGRKKR